MHFFIYLTSDLKSLNHEIIAKKFNFFFTFFLPQKQKSNPDFYQTTPAP